MIEFTEKFFEFWAGQAWLLIQQMSMYPKHKQKFKIVVQIYIGMQNFVSENSILAST